MDNIKEKIELLRTELHQHNYNYYVLNAPTISDKEFDDKMKELQQLEQEHPEYEDENSPTKRVGSDITKDFVQVYHKYPMLSLANTYSEAEVTDFYNRIRKALNEDFELEEGESRKATQKILKNRGLVPSRPKENRNPRVKKRRRYEQAVKRRKGQVVPMRTNEADQYMGEKSGIRADVTHSRLFN